MHTSSPTVSRPGCWGYTSTPFTVVWGNPITIEGWDEGVPYDVLFPSRGRLGEAVIGGSPLLMHVMLLAISLYALTRANVQNRRTPFFGFYLLAVMNLAELIAYIIMRRSSQPATQGASMQD